jgi:aminoglycoside phosphotransferase
VTLSFVFELTGVSSRHMDLEMANMDIKMRLRRDPKTGAYV